MPAESLVHQVAREIHESVFQLPLEALRESALITLRRAIPFDSAIWGSGAQQPQLVFGIASYQFPGDRLIEYASRWQPEDRLRAACAASPGRSLRNEDLGPIENYWASPIYQGFCAPSRIEHALGNAQLDATTNVGELLFLFREERGAFFSDAERDALDGLAPHLVDAWRHRLLVHVREQTPRPPAAVEAAIRRSYAIVDDDGRVHASDAEFGLGMRATYPNWIGPLLPLPILRGLQAGNSFVEDVGRRFAIRRGERRHLVAFAARGVRVLTPAELRVASLFAEGNTAAVTARLLGVSQLTVRNQLTSAYAKLGVHSKLELARALEKL